ncbi:hypothetical protein [Propionivibrio sp.]|uniref:hypothetical protein n=1 Tax=Propionivibrio sp. TaxID=2212460 RepID=UPI003BF30D1D
MRPGVAAVDGAGAADAGNAVAAFFPSGFWVTDFLATGFATGFFATGLAAALTTCFAAAFFTTGFLATTLATGFFATGLAASFFSAGLAAAALGAAFLAAGFAVAAGFFALVAISTSISDFKEKFKLQHGKKRPFKTGPFNGRIGNALIESMSGKFCRKTRKPLGMHTKIRRRIRLNRRSSTELGGRFKRGRKINGRCAALAICVQF